MYNQKFAPANWVNPLINVKRTFYVPDQVKGCNKRASRCDGKKE